MRLYRTIDEFLTDWKMESDSTYKVLQALTDESLGQAVSPQDRTLGEIAWHIVTTLHEMMSRTGLVFDAPKVDEPVPSSAQTIAERYRQASEAMVEAIRQQWTDETLKETNDMYGMQWTNAFTLSILIRHEIHHRGQMTVLMRQAGLRLPGVYGPSRDEM
jgi:uncharacterized damage-inducible protein DinB